MVEQSVKILIIDDDNSMLELTRINLEKLGYEAETAKTASDALIAYRNQLDNQQPYAAVIIDLRLGGAQHGTSVASELLAMHPEARLIVSSGDSSNPAMVNFAEYGFRASLEKDFNRENMKQTIENVIAGH